MFLLKLTYVGVFVPYVVKFSFDLSDQTIIFCTLEKKPIVLTERINCCCCWILISIIFSTVNG